MDRWDLVGILNYLNEVNIPVDQCIIDTFLHDYDH